MPNNEHRLYQHHHPNHHAPASEYPPQPPPKLNHKILSMVLKAIIMVLISSLFVIFLGIAAISVLLQLFLATAVMRRHHRRHTHHVDSSDAAEDIETSLPKLMYASQPQLADRDCCVCLECFKEGEWCRILPACCHMFHAHCVEKWLLKVPNCPICRSPVRQIAKHTSSVIRDDF